MATDPLAFDTDKCPIDPVTRIPPCEQMLTDPRIATPPDEIPDCTGTDLTLPVEPPSSSVEVTEASINMLPAGATPTINFVATQLDCGRTGLTLDIGVPESPGGGNSESGSGGGGGGGGGCPTITADASAEVGDSDAAVSADVVVTGTPCAPHFGFSFVLPPSSFSGSATVYQTQVIDGQTVILSSEITISNGTIIQTPYVFSSNTGEPACIPGSGLAALTKHKCLSARVVNSSGKCFGFTGAEVSLISGSGTSWSSGSVELIHGSGPVTFTRSGPVPSVSIGGVPGYYLGADCDGLLYEFGSEPLCGSISDSASDSDAPCLDVFVVKFACGCCPIKGWDGEGWYCIRPRGSDLGCRAEVLLNEDKCDHTIEICSGPYENGLDALVVCAGTGPAICDACKMGIAPNTDSTLSLHFGVTFPSMSGFCSVDCASVVPGTYIFAYDPDPFSHGRSMPPAGSCNWYLDNLPAPCTGGGFLETWTLRKQSPGSGFIPGATWELSITTNGTFGGPIYAANADTWDCKSPITLTLATSDSLCDWPATVVLFPV